ncbi:acyl-CoA N-acyltransferase [Hypoxylon sp. FL1284]|nr:acyl-CoA N-acyltransferase [Hypoxylon sp. FL1284]
MTTATSESKPEPIVVTDKCLVRPYVVSDAPALAEAANRPEIYAFMRDTFPHPYTVENSLAWIDFAQKGDPMVNFAICSLDSMPIGAIGLKPFKDVERCTYELGYWLSKDHWGKGITTSAAKAFCVWAFKNLPDMVRLESCAFEGNFGSLAVLERAGFVKEGVRRKSAIKHGVMLDQVTYSMLREEVEGLS